MLQPVVVRLITFASEDPPTWRTCSKAIEQRCELVFIRGRPQCGIIRHLLPRGLVVCVLWVRDRAWLHVTHLLHPSNKNGGQPGCKHMFCANTRTKTTPLKQQEVMVPITMIQEKLEFRVSLFDLHLLADGAIGACTKGSNRVIIAPLSRIVRQLSFYKIFVTDTINSILHLCSCQIPIVGKAMAR